MTHIIAAMIFKRFQSILWAWAVAICPVLLLVLGQVEIAQAHDHHVPGVVKVRTDAQRPPARPAQDIAGLRPQARVGDVPSTRWAHKPRHLLWNRAALSALRTHGQALVDTVPDDIAQWCPHYPEAGPDLRGAFWVGFLSTLAKHESTYKPSAVGGNGRWFGLLQISPGTARGYGCNAESGSELQEGAANLSCAVRIMAVTVPRDGVIYGPGGRGVAADWGPMRSTSKRADMAGWLRRQSYCVPVSATRPRSRPVVVARD